MESYIILVFFIEQDQERKWNDSFGEDKVVLFVQGELDVGVFLVTSDNTLIFFFVGFDQVFDGEGFEHVFL